MKKQMLRCTATEKLKIKERTIGQEFWWDTKCTREKRNESAQEKEKGNE